MMFLILKRFLKKLFLIWNGLNEKLGRTANCKIVSVIHPTCVRVGCNWITISILRSVSSFNLTIENKEINTYTKKVKTYAPFKCLIIQIYNKYITTINITNMSNCNWNSMSTTLIQNIHKDVIGRQLIKAQRL